MILPSKDQIAAAVATVKKAHQSFGYRRPLNDRYAETIVWAAVCAVLLRQEPSHPGEEAT